MLLFSFSNFTKDNLSKSGLTVYRKFPPPPTKKKKIPNNNSAQGHLRAMSVIQVVQHRSLLNDKKNASAVSLTCAMFIKYKLKVYFKDAHELFGSIYKRD